MRELFPSLTAGIFAAGRGLWRATKWAGRAMLYLLAALILVHIIATVVTGWQLQRQMTELRSAGILLPAQDLIPSLPPGAENAAPVYEKAWDALRFSVEDETALFDQGVKHDAKWLALARQVVAANPEYYRLLDRAARTQHCVFEVNWTSLFEARFDHYGHMRRDARMLTLRSAVAVADGQLDDALVAVTLIFGVAKHAQTDPVVIGQLVSYAMQGIGVSALENALSAGTPSPSACRSLYDELGKLDNLTWSVRAIKGELGLFETDVFNLVRSGSVSVKQLASADASAVSRRPRTVARLRAWLRRPLLNADQRFNLSYMKRDIEACELPWPDSQRVMADLEDWLETRVPRYAFVSRAVTPVFARFIWSRDSKTAAVGAARVALALKVYRLERRAYPATLAALEQAGWKLPRDPFGGAEYRYRREGGGFVVWSIGPDLEDDNAARDFIAYANLPLTEAERKQNPYDYDIIFRCTR